MNIRSYEVRVSMDRARVAYELAAHEWFKASQVCEVTVKEVALTTHSYSYSEGVSDSGRIGVRTRRP